MGGVQARRFQRRRLVARMCSVFILSCLLHCSSRKLSLFRLLVSYGGVVTGSSEGLLHVGCILGGMRRDHLGRLQFGHTCARTGQRVCHTTSVPGFERGAPHNITGTRCSYILSGIRFVRSSLFVSVTGSGSIKTRGIWSV